MTAKRPLDLPGASFLPESPERLRWIECTHGLPNNFAADVGRGLGSYPKFIPSLYFYDERGSALFEEITRLPEYYPTRTEAALLKRHAADIFETSGPVSLVELGAGTSVKTDFLLEGLLEQQEDPHYLPLDISRAPLKLGAARLLSKYPSLNLTAVCATFSDGLDATMEEVGGSKMVAFLGSTLGNFSPGVLEEFATSLSSHLKVGDFFLLGVDLIKPAEVLEAAYNDGRGITAQFNLNVLARINRELDGNFILENFTHNAVFNEAEGQIEMYLTSRCSQEVTVGALERSFAFAAREGILTEISRKFTVQGVRREFDRYGLELVQSYTDFRQWFALCLFRRR